MALDIITAAVPNLIAFDVMAVQPMDNRIGMINYLDYNYSKDKGTTKAGQTFNSALLKNASDPAYASDLVVNEAHPISASAATITVDWHPLSTVEAVYDNNNNSVAFTFDKTNDTITVTGGTLPETAATYTFTYRYDNESVQSDLYTSTGNGAWGTNVPEVELKMNSIPVEARARTLRSYWAFDAQYELQKEYGQDIETLLATQVTGK